MDNLNEKILNRAEIEQKQVELNALEPGEYILYRSHELNLWQAAKKRIGKAKQFEITNDKIIRVKN